ncbi:hypothetical protein [Pinirhizobacter soli]|uniref:hypothetical protein n=1 Tax=Pinirhizobacter soli TaxID=2786953 RepID=UPI00202A1CBA|nr:hypothetical protein [Pinirhizobacter soli]
MPITFAADVDSTVYITTVPHPTANDSWVNGADQPTHAYNIQNVRNHARSGMNILRHLAIDLVGIGILIIIVRNYIDRVTSDAYHEGFERGSNLCLEDQRALTMHTATAVARSDTSYPWHRPWDWPF